MGSDLLTVDLQQEVHILVMNLRPEMVKMHFSVLYYYKFVMYFLTCLSPRYVANDKPTQSHHLTHCCHGGQHSALQAHGEI